MSSHDLSISGASSDKLGQIGQWFVVSLMVQQLLLTALYHRVKPACSGADLSVRYLRAGLHGFGIGDIAHLCHTGGRNLEVKFL